MDEWDTLHTEIHAIRLIPDYKPSLFEQKVNKMIADKYAKKCGDCKDRLERMKYQPMEGKKKGFLEGVFGG